MKFFKKKNLLNVLYAVLIALPLFSILGRVLYTQWNQNAKDSYYGETINNEEVTILSNFNNLQGKLLYFYNTNDIDSQSETGSVSNNNIYISNVKIINKYDLTDTQVNNLLNAVRIGFYKVVGNSYYSVFLWDNLGNNTAFSSTLKFNISFNLISYAFNDGDNPFEMYNQSPFYTIAYNNYSFLDNAFDYSISQFVSENDFGKLNFFTWFSDLFLSNNSVNNLYIHFVNWYLNYTLYVSLGYILWLVLMWFVSFIRRLLEKSSTYETGGF